MFFDTENARKKTMWLYPETTGFNPSERWGHSACYSNGLLYVFGGCCVGMHFSDVVVLNLKKMCWKTMATVGNGPGPRDSHSAVIVENKMIVFGGTDGRNKVNDLHMLDLNCEEWTRPRCGGSLPSPRESHTATLVCGDKLVVFGGRGEGESNYLNDLHVLDLRSMRWLSPEINGNSPAPRDSHSAVAVEQRIFVYGGDGKDRYFGDVNVFDLKTSTWSELIIHGASVQPGIRAGHACVTLGMKIYLVGGVGDKHYYNDVWVLDLCSSSWTRVHISGKQPRGRFSHSAIFSNTSDIVIYGGCGEDERPLSEVLLLNLAVDENQTPRQRISYGSDLKTQNHVNLPGKLSSRQFKWDEKNPKSRRTNDSSHSRVSDVESVQDEHSLSLSPGSSPSQSDREQTRIRKMADSPLLLSPHREINPTLNSVCNLTGAEIRCRVTGAFDSGCLITAIVDGKLFRGALFATGTPVLAEGVDPFSNSCRKPVATFTTAESGETLRYNPMGSSFPGSQRTVMKGYELTNFQDGDNQSTTFLTLGGSRHLEDDDLAHHFI